MEGAIDGSVVTNRSLVEWNEVVPFAPFLSDSNGNASSYLQWAIVLENISVRPKPVTAHMRSVDPQVYGVHR